jgi:hypothetical protein
MTFTDVWTAMQRGKEIANPKMWKDVQNTTNVLASLLGVVVFALKIFGVDLPFTDKELLVVAGAIAAILGLANKVLTTITSRKVGSEPTA